jgi:5'-3' exonuclease
MFFRSRHAAPRNANDWDRVGFAIHVTLASINKCWRQHKSDHVIFCLEGRSWRKEAYAPYKRNRSDARAALSAEGKAEDKLFWDAYEGLINFINKNTNCTILQNNIAEADDMIARWIALHPDDHHVIVSSDTDFVQLLSENVDQYNGITGELLTINGIFNDKGKLVFDKNTKEPKTIPNPEYLLFEKCMRGDPTDNVFSAYPGVREKSSKNKTGLREAFDDRHRKGFSWNNLMLQRWTDHNGDEHRVLDDYERNRQLIDLTHQPEKIKKAVDKSIKESCIKKNVPMIGAKLLKFCGKYELIKISENPSQYAEFLSASYHDTNENKRKV